MSSIIASYYRKMSEEKKEESKTGYGFAMFILVASIIAIFGMILLHVSQNNKSSSSNSYRETFS